MQNKILITLCIFCFTLSMSCMQNNKMLSEVKAEKPLKKVNETEEPHNYGGYYCPDNLGSFPAVNIDNWKNVPVVNGRMATKEETQNGTSLIFVDLEKYPDTKPLDIKMPKLARYYNRNSRKEELIIVIQALKISNDSVVGFRYLNGGNGSSYLDKVKFLSDEEIENISSSQFVSFSLDINTTKKKIWNVLTKPAYSKTLQPIFDKENKLKADWNTRSKVNFIASWNIESKVNFTSPNPNNVTSEFAGNLYGNQYIQIDYELSNDQYVEKFLVIESQETKNSELIIVCGPYGDDFKNQKTILKNWALKVKELSEKE